jgi:hypothetical protein
VIGRREKVEARECDAVAYECCRSCFPASCLSQQATERSTARLTHNAIQIPLLSNLLSYCGFPIHKENAFKRIPSVTTGN